MIQPVIEFLRDIGLQVERVSALPEDRFMPGVAIADGKLLVESGCRVSDLLHEAGHLACTPTRFRPLMGGDLAKGQRRMLRAVVEEAVEPDAPLMRAVIQCSDPEATAWAWAAGMHLGLPWTEIVRDADYEGEGACVRMGLGMGQYLGINGLMAAGVCGHPRRGGFPVMAKWLQDAT